MRFRLEGNEMTRVAGVGHLEQLRELVLDRNKIGQLEEKSVAGLRHPATSSAFFEAEKT